MKKLDMNSDFDLPEVEEWLKDYRNFEKRPEASMLNLERMEVLVEYFGHPERFCPCFHVAGSKGKGTIATSVAAILTEAGKTVGIYTSPHILHFTERVRSGDGPFEQKIYHDALEELKAGMNELIQSGALDKSLVTWYEAVTIYAMLVFRRAGVDYAVYEVGMGGRLDATNVILPEAIGMGLIELEHTEFLGDTIKKIAFEKAGVFKKKVPITSVPQVIEARTVFAKKACEKHAKVEYVPASTGNYLEIDQEVARRMVKKVCPDISDELAKKALLSVSLPGRYEKVLDIDGFSKIPYLLMDGAHTEQSIAEVIKRMKVEGDGGILIFACAKDKRVELIAKEIFDSGLFSRVYLTRPGEWKEADLPRAEKAFSGAGYEGITARKDYVQVIKDAFEFADENKRPVVVLGSFYILAEVKKVIGQG
ncbi:hypothetical protein IK146_02240 [Candidatus Saccharibacteria bacterium]|nr:hypothetical protein [Candidatus Saccharibacteria bacterium]